MPNGMALKALPRSFYQVKHDMDEQEIFQPGNSDFVQDPYPAYKFLRENDPVHQTASGLWVLSRYEDVVTGLKDTRLSNAPAPFALVNRRNADRYLAAQVANGIIAFLDPPDHLGPRRLIASACNSYFKDKKTLVRDVAESLLIKLRHKKEIEFVQDFAVPFATLSICRIMGFPDSDQILLKSWSNLFFYLFHAIPDENVLRDVNQSLENFRKYVRGHLELRKRKPTDDLLSFLLQARRGDEKLSDQEVVDNAMLLTADGIENVQAGLATAVYTLLRNPDQLRRMIQDDRLVPSAVQECLRYESPGQYQGRIARETMIIGGKTIKAYSVVLLALASANRDPAAFSDPDRFDIGRSDPRHVAFGAGRHACIGGMLVEIEFSAAFWVLFHSSTTMLKADHNMEWIARAGHRWPARLPLVIKNTG